MSKYVSEFNSTGISILYLEKVLFDWTNKFFLSKYKETYKFAISSKKKNCLDLKVEISKEQFDEILSRKTLVKVNDSIFNNACSYFTESHLKKEVERLKKIHEHHLGIAVAARNAFERYAEAVSFYSER